MIDLTLEDLLRKIKNKFLDSKFVELYKKLFTEKYNELTDIEKSFLLKNAAIFLNQMDRNIKKFGYSIILRYSNVFNDYIPLYDVSLNLGFIPIAKFIETRDDFKESFSNILMSACMEQSKNVDDKNVKFLTSQQTRLKEFVDTDNNFTIVAPTSYGKSELIIDYMTSNCRNKKICIIVPTKALLAQTKSRILRDLIKKQTNIKIITHPDMYINDVEFIGILTQERLLTLLTNNPNIKLDEIIIDEAHNLLDNNPRSVLLAQVILLVNKRNYDTKIKYLSPFVTDINSLNIMFLNKNWQFNKISEFLKIEKYFIYSDNVLKSYDPFLNAILSKKEFAGSVYDFIYESQSNKNIIYSNRPKDVESISKALKEKEVYVGDIENSREYLAIKDYLDDDYNLLDCMKHGIVYHHGAMPDNIKLYVEYVYKKNNSIKYIITTSTLLEGVNIPADKIFLMDIKKGRSYLTHSNFMNLTGRVCRFKEIFNHESGSLKLLEPEIFLLKNEFMDKRVNLENYIRDITRVIKENVDKVDNPLLVNSSDKKNKLDAHIEFIENIEKGTINTDSLNIAYVNSDIGKACFKNIIKEFDIIQNENTLVRNYDEFKDKNILISDNAAVMDAIYNIFIKDIELTDDNISRLNEEKTRNFYLMVLNWISEGSVYKSLIGKFVRYWSRDDRDDDYVYVGSKWGEKTKGGFKPLFVDVSQKTPKELINLAIIKIKEEKEYVEFRLMKFVEVLHSLGHLDVDLYNKLKYGSTDEKIISMLQNGFSLDLAICIKERYLDTIVFNEVTKEIYLTDNTIQKMSKNEENDILIFEARYYKK